MKQLKRVGAMLLCLVLSMFMFLPAGVHAAENTSGQEDRVTKEFSRIVLSVGDNQKTPVYKAGEKAVLKINVMNKGNADARNVTITPVINSTDEWPFDMSQLNYDKSLGTLSAGGKAEAAWGEGDESLTVRDDVSGKTLKLVFKLTYDDGDKLYENERYVFVKTEAKKDAAGNGDKTQGNTQAGSTTDKEAGDNKTDGGDSGKHTVSPGGSSSGIEFGDAGIYNSEPVSTGGGGSAGGSGGSGDGSVPRVIVAGFETDPGAVKAGSNFKLVIHLKNTSKKTAVTNMLFDLQAPASGTDQAAEAPAFLPVSGSSSIYLDKIPADGTKDISIDLNSRADLIQKPYSITMTMKYEDGNATQFEGMSSLAIPVVQEARFEFSEIKVMPNTVAVNEEANITCNLYNLGRVKMYNVKAKFTGSAIESEEQFIGNLESGATGSIDGIVTAVSESYDESNCKLVLTYEDDSGKEYSVEQPFTMTVTEAMEPADTDMAMDIPEENESPAGLIIAVIVIVAGAAAIVTAVLLKRRKKKIQSSEEEELMDEVERFTDDERWEP